MISLGIPETRLITFAEDMDAPSNVRVTSVQPTSIAFSWNKPIWKEGIVGYSYMFLFQGRVMHTGRLGAIYCSVTIENLFPSTRGYEFRVAGILLEGFVGEFSSPFMVTTAPLGKLSCIYTCVYPKNNSCRDEWSC